MLSNENIVALIQQGNADLYLTLWERVFRFVNHYAYRRLQMCGYDRSAPFGGVDIDDLRQAGFVAMMEAVKTYRPGRAKFTTYLLFCLRKAFREAQGVRTSKRDAIDFAVSFDRPLHSNEDGDAIGSVGDCIAAQNYIERIEDKIFNEQLRAALINALADLPERPADVIRETLFSGKTLQQYSNESGISRERVRQIKKSGIDKLKRNKALRSYLADNIDYYHGAGSLQYAITRQSNTERLALRRIDMEERLALRRIDMEERLASMFDADASDPGGCSTKKNPIDAGNK